MTDGTHHGLNELNSHFRVMIHKLREWYLCVCMYIYISDRKSDCGKLESGGLEHDVEGIEKEMEKCLAFSWDRVNFHKKLVGLTQTSQ